MLDLVAQVAALLAVGALASRRRRALAALNSALFYVTLPLSLLLSVARLSGLGAFAAALAAAVAQMYATMALAILASRLLRLTWAAELVTLASLPNAIFIGLPLVGALLGDPAYAAPHAVAFNAVLVALLAYLGRGGPRRVRAASALYFASFLAGLLLNLAGVRARAAPALDYAAGIVSRANMLSFVIVGAGLAGLRVSRPVARRLAAVAAFRYLASPLTMAAALAALPAARADGRLALGGVLQSVMPPAVTCIVLARELGMDSELVTAGVALLSPASIALAVALAQLLRA